MNGSRRNGIFSNLPSRFPLGTAGSYREPDFTGSGIDYCASRLPNAAIMRRITARIDAGMVSIIVIADGP
jgi:hypothetical protein